MVFGKVLNNDRQRLKSTCKSWSVQKDQLITGLFLARSRWDYFYSGKAFRLSLIMWREYQEQTNKDLADYQTGWHVRMAAPSCPHPAHLPPFPPAPPPPPPPALLTDRNGMKDTRALQLAGTLRASLWGPSMCVSDTHVNTGSIITVLLAGSCNNFQLLFITTNPVMFACFCEVCELPSFGEENVFLVGAGKLDRFYMPAVLAVRKF